MEGVVGEVAIYNAAGVKVVGSASLGVIIRGECDQWVAGLVVHGGGGGAEPWGE